jgi:hypothetical protein
MINYDGSKELTYDFPRDFQVKQNGKVYPFYKLANNRIRFANELPEAGDIDIVEVIKSQAQKPSFGHTLADMAFITHDDVDRIDDTAHRLDATEKQAQETLKVTQELLSETTSYENANKQAIEALSADTQKSFDVVLQNMKANQDSTNNLIEGAVIKSQNETGAVADRLNKHELANNPHGINKKMLGIENVNNTSDMNKPVSKAMQEALDLKADKEEVTELEQKVEEQAKNQKKMIDGLASFGAGMTDPLPSQKGKKGKYLKTDGKKTYWADASGGGGSAVDSVNGQTGEVVLTASDVGAVAVNEAITAGTYTKITYDTKGLVTGGASLQASDIPDLSATYQPLLVSGTNIKTINNTSLLGDGDISVDSLPSQTGHSGEYLTTDGTNASWAAVSGSQPVYNSTTNTLEF